LFPDNCRICSAPLAELGRIPVCERCLGSVEPIHAEYMCQRCRSPFATPHPLDERGYCYACRSGLISYDGAFAYGFYEGVLEQLVHLFKYQGMRPLAGFLGSLMVSALPRDVPVDVIVPMPMHWLKRWQRGFNQAELLARVVSRVTGIRLKTPVRRIRNTPAQAGLSRSERRRNVAGAFRVVRPEWVRGQHVLLVDDVLTTGATAGACATELKRAGAASVVVLTVARADRRLASPGLIAHRNPDLPGVVSWLA